MSLSFRILLCEARFALNLVHFMTNSKRTQIFLVVFECSVLELKEMKNRVRHFWLLFIFWDINYIIFLFPLKLVLKVENPSITWKPHNFLKILSTVLLSDYFLECIPLLKELRQRFFELQLEHYKLTEYPLRRLTLFHRYCNFNPPARSNDVWYWWNAKINAFYLFVLWKF